VSLHPQISSASSLFAFRKCSLRLKTLLKKMDSARSEDWRKRKLKVVFLTAPDSPDTLVLPP
jgi:hypothetical protein